MLCNFAEYNKFRRLICTLGEGETPPMCPYQKYCHLSNAWENSPAMNKCTKRSNQYMDEKKNKNYYKKPEKVALESKAEEVLEVKNEVDEEIPVAKEEVFEEKEAIVEKKKNAIKGKVRCVFDNGDIAVNLDNGEFVMKYGYPNAKIGDILDFEI